MDIRRILTEMRGNILWDAIKWTAGALSTTFGLSLAAFFSGLRRWLTAESVGLVVLVCIGATALVALVGLGILAWKVITANPRVITRHQKRRLQTELAALPKNTISIVVLARNEELDRFAAEIARAFVTAGWSIGKGPQHRGTIGYQPPSMWIAVPDRNEPNFAASSLARAFANAGLTLGSIGQLGQRPERPPDVAMELWMV